VVDLATATSLDGKEDAGARACLPARRSGSRSHMRRLARYVHVS
jgi:hypothetical protein